MFRQFMILAALTTWLLHPPAAKADPDAPDVAVTIAPVHSLVARVMQGAGTPRLLLPPGASPHDYALRPSDAKALQGADLVVWIGPGVARWLETPLETLAHDAEALRLDQVPGLTRLSVREDAAFDHDDEHGHDRGHNHGHNHGHGDTGLDGHDSHGTGIDPHFWLDPVIAGIWLDVLAKKLAEIDPARAALYRANATVAQRELDALSARISARLVPVLGQPFIVLHDAFYYFENRFGINATGVVTLPGARPPGPARLAKIRTQIASHGIVCLFGTPQMRSSILETLAEGSDTRIGVLDPLGAMFTPGPDLYGALLERLSESLVECLE